MEPIASVPNIAAARFREILSRPGMLRVPGVHDGFSARAAQFLGFEAIYVGGGSSASIHYGFPDMGVMGPAELIAHAGHLASLVEIPVIADLDDAGGTPFRVYNSVAQLSRRGIAAFHIEDVDYGRGKHFPGQRGGTHAAYERDAVIPLRDAVHRVRAAVDAARPFGTVVIARSDAAITSKDLAIERGIAFASEGADAIFLPHLRAEDTADAAAALPVPLVNCVLDYKGASNEECLQLERDGLRVLIDHRSVPLAMYRAAWQSLGEFRDSGAVGPDDPETRSVIRDLVSHDTWAEWAERYGMLE